MADQITLSVKVFTQSIRWVLIQKMFYSILNFLGLTEKSLISVGRVLKILIPE
jgi:hypothetical protein